MFAKNNHYFCQDHDLWGISVKQKVEIILPPTKKSTGCAPG